jgi:hypothetical protein
MSIKQNGGVFGRNPTFNDVTIEGDLIINGEIFTGLDFQGSWNASTNSPTLVSSTGTNGEFYIVSVAGTTSLDGLTNWGIGDWAIFNGSIWQRVEGGADGNFDDLTVAGTSVLTGKAGIGASVSTEQLHISQETALTNTAQNVLRLTHTTSGSSAVGFGTAIRFQAERTGGTPDMIGTIGFVADTVSGSTINGAFVVNTTVDGSPTERLRIASNGTLSALGTFLLAGTSTNPVGTNVVGIALGSDGRAQISTSGSTAVKLNTTVDGDTVQFRQSGSAVGSISVTSSATAYNTSSDYRLKEDDVPMTDATERVKALRPINFAWKIDGSRVDGFFAHEAGEVVPEAVHGTKDAMQDEEYEVTAAIAEVTDKDGNVTIEAAEAVMATRSVPDYQGIDQSKLVPLLTAALQEAITKIEVLTTRIETLEGQ